VALPNSAQDAGKLRWLFLDLNSYFASVEQQERPELRGKPIIVTPVDSDRTCAIAASYEAKAFGIRTGTLVREARRLCPGLKLVPARHDYYVEYHHRIADEIERHLHITKAHSIDEVACELLGAERQTKNAVALAREVQQGILDRVGECLHSSIGLGPSVLLAKTASDMKKPGGITVLGMDQLPARLLELDMQDLCGVGRRMEPRLRAAGVSNVAALWALSPSRARAIWGSIAGERFWYALHGTDPPEIETERRSISHSHVLGPSLRNVDAAYLVARRLLARAASRLRRAEHMAGGLSLWLGMKDKIYRDAAARLPTTADTFRLLDTLDGLWREAVRPKERLEVMQVGVTLYALTPVAAIAPDLFGWTPEQTEDARRLRLSLAIDRLNQRHGTDTVSIGVAPTGLPGYMGAKIAFNRIPDREDFAG
jgi:DNA polymerase IV